MLALIIISTALGFKLKGETILNLVSDELSSYKEKDSEVELTFFDGKGKYSTVIKKDEIIYLSIETKIGGKIYFDKTKSEIE